MLILISIECSLTLSAISYSGGFVRQSFIFDTLKRCCLDSLQ